MTSELTFICICAHASIWCVFSASHLLLTEVSGDLPQTPTVVQAKWSWVCSHCLHIMSGFLTSFFEVAPASEKERWCIENTDVNIVGFVVALSAKTIERHATEIDDDRAAALGMVRETRRWSIMMVVGKCSDVIHIMLWFMHELFLIFFIILASRFCVRADSQDPRSKNE